MHDGSLVPVGALPDARGMVREWLEQLSAMISDPLDRLETVVRARAWAKALAMSWAEVASSAASLAAQCYGSAMCACSVDDALSFVRLACGAEQAEWYCRRRLVRLQPHIEALDDAVRYTARLCNPSRCQEPSRAECTTASAKPVVERALARRLPPKRDKPLPFAVAWARDHAAAKVRKRKRSIVEGANVELAIREAMHGRAEVGTRASAPDADEYMTVASAARMAGVHQSTIRKWVKSGKLPRHPPQGRVYRIRRDELHAFMARGDPSKSPTDGDIDRLAREVISKDRGS